MKQNDKLIVAIVAIIIAVLALSNIPSLNINLPAGTGNNQNPPPSYEPPVYNPPEYPEYPEYPTPPPGYIVPTSLTIEVTPNPGYVDWTYTGDVVSNGKDYPITVHAKHVGANTEQTYGGLLDDTGKFTDSRAIDVPGYWDMWVTTDTGVSSNKPRVEVRGALCWMSRTAWSHLNPFGYDPTTTIKVYCHSSGSCLIFYNDLDAGTSTPLETVYVNSGGYATTTFNINALSNGDYEMDFVVNGIKASDYINSVFFSVGR